MATFNGEKFVADQLKSILTQAGVAVRLLVRDDGSTDGTVDILNKFASDFPNQISFVRDANKGGSAAKNFRILFFAANVEPGDMVFLADQDDIWLPDKLTSACTKLQQGTSLVSGALEIMNPNGTISGTLKKDVKFRRFDYLFQGLSAGCTYGLSSELFLLVRNALKSKWFENNTFSHDWLIYTVARANCLNIFHDCVPRVKYRQHSSNVQGAITGLGGILYRLRNINQGWYCAQILHNKSYFSEGMIENSIVQAFEDRKLLFILKNLRNLRRSLLQSCALVIFMIFRRRVP
jgi:rhamnosyltransferase